MSDIILKIGREEEKLSKLWVHLQEDEQRNYSNFTIFIPNEHLISVFDPYCVKPKGQQWSLYILANIQELGTFVIDGYLNLMRAIQEDTDVSFSWVLSSVSDVREFNNGVEIVGRVVPLS